MIFPKTTMNNKPTNQFHKAVNDLRSLSMTSSEKERVFRAIMEAPVPSRFSFASLRMVVFAHQRLVVVAAAFVLIVGAGGGTLFASKLALPGDTLYPVKTRVAEPLRAVATFSSQAEAELQIATINERLEEAETLAARNDLDDEKQLTLSTLLEEHNDRFTKAVKTVARKDKDKALSLHNAFEADIQAHQRILSLIDEDDDEIPQVYQVTTTTPSGVIPEGKKNKRAKKVVETVEKLVATPQILDDDHDEDDGEDNEKAHRFEAKKENVREIIESTHDDLEDADDSEDSVKPTPLSVSLKKKKVIESAHSSLEDARDLLDEAEDHERRGEGKKALKAIRDSEKSAKEAKTLLKAGLKVRHEERDEDED